MEFSTLSRVLLRRWYLVIAALLITAGATAYVVKVTGPTYKAEGSVLLFPPSTTVREGTTVETQGNPYLMLGGLSQARDIVIRSITARSAREAFGEKVPGASYEATPDYTTSGPVIVVTTQADAPRVSIHALDQVIADVPSTLERLQAEINLKESARITSLVITSDTRPEVVRKGQIRTGLATCGALLLVALLSIGLIDGLLTSRPTRRQRRRRGARVEGVSVDTAPAPDAGSNFVVDGRGAPTHPRPPRTRPDLEATQANAPGDQPDDTNLTDTVGTNRA